MPQLQPELERKCYSASNIKSDDQQGVIEAIVSVFNNVDRGDDIIRAGAFSESIKRKLPKGVWHHQWNMSVAKTLEAKELLPGDPLLPSQLRDLGGLWIKGQFNLKTQRGKEAFEDIQFGIIDEFSIGYRAVKWAYDEENETRELLEIDLYEWSPVLVGMNPATALLSVKEDTPAGLPLAEQSEQVLACLSAWTKRMSSFTELRAKERRVISESNRTRMQSTCDLLRETMASMQSAHDDLTALIMAAEPKPKPQKDAETTAPDAPAAPASVKAEQQTILNELARFENLKKTRPSDLADRRSIVDELARFEQMRLTRFVANNA